MPLGVSISASPPESSNSRFQRVSAAITRRASARSGVTRAADLFRCRASRIATAIASASISELGASTTASFAMPPAILSETSGCARRSCHCSVALDGRIVSDTSTSRPCCAGVPRISTSLRLMPKRSSRPCIANCGWFEDGCVVNLPCASLTPPIDLPGFLVEIGVEPGQHDRAQLQAGHGGEEFRGRRHRAGRAGSNHGPLMMRGQARGFRLDQAVAPFGGFDPADFPQMLRPCLARDTQKFQRVLPVFVELVGHQFVERFPGDAARHHVVHQPRQIAGQRQCRGRAADHERRRHRAFRPCRNQMRQRQPSLEFTEPWRKVERRYAAELFGALRKRQFVLVDIAERHDARQDRSVGLQFVEKDLPRQPSCAPGRQIERRASRD